ncbi:hypothetical protein CKAH01_14111 [Colletotrichum kahawae]|uniref:Uncharacterized protein n=1 Tax=Colletotrichum kahawae TaxID=34407 RepID=A0AAD9YQK8_COLKA|nr:hypothetical protein CKAH01_14111 [Colletotrichum kahawae]
MQQSDEKSGAEGKMFADTNKTATVPNLHQARRSKANHRPRPRHVVGRPLTKVENAEAGVYAPLPCVLTAGTHPTHHHHNHTPHALPCRKPDPILDVLEAEEVAGVITPSPYFQQTSPNSRRSPRVYAVTPVAEWLSSLPDRRRHDGLVPHGEQVLDQL